MPHEGFGKQEEFEDLTPEQRLVFIAITKLASEGPRHVPLNDLFDKICSTNAGADIGRVRRTLVRAIKEHSAQIPGLRLVEAEAVAPERRKTSHIKINAGHHKMFAAFLANLDAVRTSEGFEYFQVQALAIARKQPKTVCN